MIKIVKKIHGRINFIKLNVLPRYFIATPFLSSVYYLFLSPKFRREQHATLVGKVKHLKEMKNEEFNRFTLIRNIHRIEKGLLMKPRRKVFALDYIDETLTIFLNIWDEQKANTDKQYKWFSDVLAEYFSKSGEYELLYHHKKKFEATVNSNLSIIQKNINEKSIPYYRLPKDKPDLSYEQFFKLTRHRRSVRWFLNQKVPRELIDAAILAANQSPSACNRQPFQYRVIDDPVLRKEVADLPMGIRGYADNIPVLIVVVGNLSAYFDERDRHVIYVDASLANMTLMLALETLGLSSCAINWPDIESLEQKMKKVLGLSTYERPIMCLALGYPDPKGMVAYSEKRNLDDLRKYN